MPDEQTKFDITIHHPQYDEYLPLWKKTNTSIKGEAAIKSAGPTYLPKTTGQEKNDKTGKQYEAYKQRARFYELASEAQGALLGLVFEKEPTGNSELDFSLNGDSDSDFSVTVIREIVAKGRYIAVADAHDDTVLVSGYVAESMINWKTNGSGKLTLAVFEEEIETSGNPLSHDTEKQYRLYQLVENQVQITVYNEKSEITQETIVVESRDKLDIVVFGSLNLDVGCDPIPVLPVVDCALSAYALSADYKHALFMCAQPTPVLSGIDKTHWELILKQGIGSSALWWLPDEATAEFLETSGNSIDKMKEAIQDEIRQAEYHSVRLTQVDSGNVEAAASIAMRSSSQHATVHTIIRSAVTGIRLLRGILEERNGTSGSEVFEIHAEFTPAYASTQMLIAVNNAVSQGNLPHSVLFNNLRKMKMTDKTDEELLDEIETLSFGGGNPEE